MALLVTAPHVAELTREQLYQNADHLFWQAFSWTPEGRAAFTRMALMHLEAQVAGAGLRRKLTPDYPIGCKRVLFADDYYPALERPNVALETGPIEAITPAHPEWLRSPAGCPDLRHRIRDHRLAKDHAG